jgi:hypothetical protein
MCKNVCSHVSIQTILIPHLKIQIILHNAHCSAVFCGHVARISAAMRLCTFYISPYACKSIFLLKMVVGASLNFNYVCSEPKTQ